MWRRKFGMPARKDGKETRRRILEVACEVFSQKGFHDATHAEICRLSKVNPAAINYHFRNKETLYAEAWKMAFQNSLKLYPPGSGVPADAPPETRLRGRILSLVRRAYDPACREFDLLHKEMSNPTGLLDEPMREVLTPLQQNMMAVIRELLGVQASDTDVALCAMSILAQCFHHLRHRRHRVITPVDQHIVEIKPDVLADHITAFSLAGIYELRRRTLASSQLSNTHQS